MEDFVDDGLDQLQLLEELDELDEVVGLGPVIRDYGNPLEELPNTVFKNRFRISKECVLMLMGRFLPALEHETGRNYPLPPIFQLLIALRFYSTGCYQSTIGDLIGVDNSTVSRIVWKVTPLIARLRPEYVTFPRLPEEQQECARKFYAIANFPGVIGTVDCTHVPIQSPGGQNGELFRNRKGSFSINVQAICGPNGEFTDIVAQWPGSTHDATIFDFSRIRGFMENGNVLGHLLGDNGYPCRPYLLTPFLNTRNAAEERYNRAQIQTRNTVERLFGVCKRRFPCLSLGLRLKLERSLAVVVATAVLHNIAVFTNDELPDDNNPDDPDDPIVLNAANNNDLGVAVRAAIVRNHFM